MALSYRTLKSKTWMKEKVKAICTQVRCKMMERGNQAEQLFEIDLSNEEAVAMVRIDNEIMVELPPG